MCVSACCCCDKGPAPPVWYDNSSWPVVNKHTFTGQRWYGLMLLHDTSAGTNVLCGCPELFFFFHINSDLICSSSRCVFTAEPVCRNAFLKHTVNGPHARTTRTNRLAPKWEENLLPLNNFNKLNTKLIFWVRVVVRGYVHDIPTYGKFCKLFIFILLAYFGITTYIHTYV